MCDDIEQQQRCQQSII